MRKTVGLLILIAITLAGLIWLRPHYPPPALPATSAPTPDAWPTRTAAAAASSPVPVPAEPTTTPSPATAHLRSLRPGPLAEAWLTGYLTRSSRNDVRWVAAVTPLSSPELLAELEATGPDNVGLDRLTSWRVTKIRPYQAVDRPVNTRSRTTLAYAAFVTDGHHTTEKPFLLTSYLQPDGRWLITSVDQPYSSEG